MRTPCPCHRCHHRYAKEQKYVYSTAWALDSSPYGEWMLQANALAWPGQVAGSPSTLRLIAQRYKHFRVTRLHLTEHFAVLLTSLQHSLPQLPPQHYLASQLSLSHALAPQHSTPLLPQHSMPLLPQHSTPLLQTVESRLAGPETSLDIGSMQLPGASVVGKTACCQACTGSKHCSSAALGSSAAAGAGSIGTCRICFEQVGSACT
jgi:hypothetical protein